MVQRSIFESLVVPEYLVADYQSVLGDPYVFLRYKCLEEVLLILINEHDVLGKRASFELAGVDGIGTPFKCPNDDFLRGKDDCQLVSLNVSVD